MTHRSLFGAIVFAAACSPPPLAPTLANVQSQVFTPSCIFSACHSGTAPMGGLSLEDGKSYDQLVNVNSSAAMGRVRVVPGDVTASYLNDKLTKDPPAVGAPMPLGNGALEPDRLQLVQAWITAGAKKN
jgi:hypothetical protein